MHRIQGRMRRAYSFTWQSGQCHGWLRNNSSHDSHVSHKANTSLKQPERLAVTGGSRRLWVSGRAARTKAGDAAPDRPQPRLLRHAGDTVPGAGKLTSAEPCASHAVPLLLAPPRALTCFKQAARLPPSRTVPIVAVKHCCFIWAQAQECFYTKAAADRKSPALLARITSQVTAAVVCRPSKCEYEPCGLSCIITVASSRVFRHAF